MEIKKQNKRKVKKTNQFMEEYLLYNKRSILTYKMLKYIQKYKFFLGYNSASF